MFFEEFQFENCQDHISYVELDDDGYWTMKPRAILEANYPFVFQVEDQIYMLPESYERGRVQLFRAQRFPLEWTLDCVLLDGVEAVDSTILERDGKWWMFVNIRVDGGSHHDELRLFFAPTFRGPWKPHPMNHVVSDIRRARPAGRLFTHEGELIRPSQDCSGSYGHLIGLNRVDCLIETEYREMPIGKIDPDWAPGLLATHGIDFTALFEVVDTTKMVAPLLVKAFSH